MSTTTTIHDGPANATATAMFRTLACMSSTRTEITQSRRSVRFVTWARAWRAGTVSYDDVADETERDEEHLVADAPDTWTDIPLREAVRALSGPGPFTGRARATGEAVVAGRLGLVPEVREHTSGSGDTFSIVVWQAFPLPATDPFTATAPDEPAQAEAELSEA